MAIDLKPGEVVFSPSFTYVATAEAISLLRGVPYFVDVDEKNFNISPQKLDTEILKAKSKGLVVKAFISVDLFGNPANYNALSEVAKKHNITFIADVAQAFGASYQNQKVCSLADISTTSFFPTKPLGCYGDGGMIFTNSNEYASKMRSICFHGKGDDKYQHVRVGMNSRMDTLQAAVLLEKMKYFDDELQKRNATAEYYNHELKDLIQTPTINESDVSAWAVYTLRHTKRDVIIEKLSTKGIPSNVYYRTPLHLQQAYKNCLKAADLSVSEKIADEVFCLPMHAFISEEQAKYIVTELKEILRTL
jgi:dTDP-4-amino-4,6-dideoxygalactose transaminase